MWYDNIRIRSGKVEIKMKDKNGEFVKNISIPTNYYPLHGNGIKVFTRENTRTLIEGHTVLDLIDAVPYQIGDCYTNTKNVVDVLRSRGLIIDSYVGWLFVGDTDFPAHHCWAVIDDNIVIDLADDYGMCENLNESEYQTTNMKNSLRCYPFGRPTENLLYVGTICDADTGRKEYQDLLLQYPNHESVR